MTIIQRERFNLWTSRHVKWDGFRFFKREFVPYRKNMAYARWCYSFKVGRFGLSFHWYLLDKEAVNP